MVGACHADELFYLFVNKNLETLVTEADKQGSWYSSYTVHDY